MGTVERLWMTDEGSAPMRAVESIRAIEGRGLDGDRYAEGTGFYSGFDECQVTLIAAEAIDDIRDDADIDLADGRHRRNIVTRGADLRDLLGSRFEIGDATFSGTRPRPPCAHVEQVAGEDGVAAALGDGRGGVCADVVDSGAVAVGDDVVITESLDMDPQRLASSIRDRYD
jgi:MOSC domain-containing protein YiiM